MNISDNAVRLVARWEGFQADAYFCPAQVWTIGYGATTWPNGKRVVKGEKISQDEALELLRRQIQQHTETIPHYTKCRSPKMI